MLLAWQDEEIVKGILEQIEFVRKTETTLLNANQLTVELAMVREQGYAEDREEQELGLRCVAVPIYDRLGQVIAGLSISFPTIRFDEQQLDDYVSLLKVAGCNISEMMGYHNYPL